MPRCGCSPTGSDCWPEMRGEPNHRLRRVRDERQESREEFARQIQAGAGEACDARMVKRWEDGTVRLPRPVFRRAVVALTGRTATDLGWDVPSDAAAVASPNQVDPDALLAALRDAERAARACPAGVDPSTFRALAYVYRACSLVLATAGEHPAAWVAADRGVAAAEAAGDMPLMVEVVADLPTLLARSGRPDRARRAASTALDAVSGWTAPASQEGVELADRLAAILADRPADSHPRE